MQQISLLFGAIFAPLIAGTLTLVLPRKAITLRVAVALAGPMLALILLATYIANFGTAAGPLNVDWMPLVKLNLGLHADKLGLFFALLVSGIGFFITLYARAYFGPEKNDLYRFYPSLMLFMTAMIGVALADNFMLLLLFWEMTSISSFLLIGWERDDPSAVRKAMQAFIVTGLGGLAMMGGLILMGLHTGMWSFSGLLSISHTLHANPLLTTAFVLIFVGAAAKSAQWPLHFWLPGAMAAPTPVSAYLHSATMVKAGVYLTGRLWPILAIALPLWPQLVLPLGAITMVFGAFVALQKTDLKQIFAYTTVSQLGLLMAMYGLAAFDYAVAGHGATHALAQNAGTLLASAGDTAHALAAAAQHAAASGAHEVAVHTAAPLAPSAAAATRPDANLIWDVTQILNHALYKAPLFILAGAIGHIASRDLTELKGLFWRGRTQRIMTIVIVAAAYALAALPFTVSFTAKEMFFYQIAHAAKSIPTPAFYALVAAGVATGMFNVAIFLRIAAVLLGRPAQPDAQHANHHDDHQHADHQHETGLWPAFLWIPGAAIVSLQFIGGTIPGAWEAMFGWLEATPYYFDHFPLVWDAHPGLPLYMSLIAIALGAALAASPLLRRVFNDPHDKLYPGFYLLCTKGGGKIFGLFQRGHAGYYVAAICIAIVALFIWVVANNASLLTWPKGATLESIDPLLPGLLLTILVCTAAILMPIVQDRAARVLVLGVVGFSVTGVYYIYQAPDLALTQVSIEIVSLILFLLVLSLLPDQTPGPTRWITTRLLIAASVGFVAFWLTLTSSLGPQPTMPYRTADGKPLNNLGEFFLRNSYAGQDTATWSTTTGAGVVDRAIPKGHGSEHPPENASENTHGHKSATHTTRPLHSGGGGNNVVNVILVDGRGFDTMGEITVLGLAALGVWTLLRRPRNSAANPNHPADDDQPRNANIPTPNENASPEYSDFHAQENLTP